MPTQGPLAVDALRRPDHTAMVSGVGALQDYIRATIFGSYHQVGTCKMGDDPQAVAPSSRAEHRSTLG